MKILLINPVLCNKPELSGAEYGHDNIPMFAAYLSSAVRQCGATADFFDAQLHPREESLARLRSLAEKYDAFGMIVYTTYIPDALAISDILKQVSGKPIIWGGAHPTLFPEQTAAEPVVDFVVVGAGEFILQHLVQSKFAHPSKILRDDGQGDLGSFEPDYGIYDIGAYHALTPGFRNLTLYTSRGCSMNCSFCINRLLHRKVDLYPLETVERALDTLVVTHRAKHVFVMDEHFYHGEERLQQMVRLLGKYSITWEANIRANIVSRMPFPQLAELKEAGCIRIRMGCESASDRILKILRKGISVSDTLVASVNCLRAGITPSCSFITDLPDELPHEKMATSYLCYLLSRTGAQIIGPQKYRPYPGSEETQKLLDRKLLVFPATLRGWEASMSLFAYVEPHGQDAELARFFAESAGNIQTTLLVKLLAAKLRRQASLKTVWTKSWNLLRELARR